MRNLTTLRNIESTIKHREIMAAIIKLSAKEIEEQIRFAQKYYDLIQKELSYEDLVNVENVARYTKAYQSHMKLATQGYFEI